MTESDEIKRLREQMRADRKLFERAAEAMAEIDRNHGLDDRQADVLAALRIRVEGKKRDSLEELLSAAGDISGKRDLGDVLDSPDEGSKEWPSVKESRKEWPGL